MRKARIPALLALALCAACAGGPAGSPAPGGAAAPPRPGDPAPEFRLEGATMEAWDVEGPRRPEDWRGKTLVVAFFPAAWTGGCDRQFETLAGRRAEFDALGAEIVGISGDSKFTLHEWAKQTNIPFLLLGDHLHEAARAWGSFDPASGFNRRAVFLVDREGIVRYADTGFDEADPEEYDRLLEAVKALSAPPSGSLTPEPSREPPWRCPAFSASA